MEDAVNHVFINGFIYGTPPHHCEKKSSEWVIVTMKLMAR